MSSTMGSKNSRLINKRRDKMREYLKIYPLLARILGVIKEGGGGKEIR